MHKQRRALHEFEPLFARELSPRRRIDPTKYPDIKAWVIKAIAEEDRKPNILLWRDEPTKEDQNAERLRRIRFLRKYEADNPIIKAIASRLVLCARKTRCCSGACPECGRLLQRWFVRRSKSFIRNVVDKDDQLLVAITIIPSQPTIQPWQLNSFSIENLQRRLKSALDKVGLGDAIGGIDISFNEDRDGKYEPFWCVHIYLITSVRNETQIKRLLKEIYKQDDGIPRPVKITDFDNSAYRRSYAFKIVFPRRIGYDDLKVNNGVTRKYRDTSRDKLRAQERLELFIYLDQCGLTNRFIFRGAKPVIEKAKVTIRKVELAPSYQRKSKNWQKLSKNRSKMCSFGLRHSGN